MLTVAIASRLICKKFFAGIKIPLQLTFYEASLQARHCARQLISFNLHNHFMRNRFTAEGIEA